VRVLLIGPPGAGKGTQAERIADHFDLGRIATGDLLREQVAKGTELGKVAKEYMDLGDLVPDELVIEMTRERMVQASEAGGTCSTATRARCPRPRPPTGGRWPAGSRST
jgi:adenylate kinase